eukprot:TRINITY_DN2100_c0_g2_i7.p1 TRINITY_DN2100_c0_g2~~TRINITY_DN2100_c0_g2_i7.p1  ORF type:complete len:319 (+),score=93.10 TRINITY_DN2100_c0_g2_i7:290-1246(+)
MNNQSISLNIKMKVENVMEVVNPADGDKEKTRQNPAKGDVKLLPNVSSVKNMDLVFDPAQSNLKKGLYTKRTEDPQVPKVKISLSHLQKLLKEKTSTRELDSKREATIKIKKSSSKRFLAITNLIAKDKHLDNPLASKKTDGALQKQPEQSETEFPLAAAQALKLFAADLSDFEKGEILDYQTVYYMGNGIAKANLEPLTGYDDDKGDYNTYVGEQINYRYEILDILGKGSFGQVLKCVDHKTGETIAVKIIRSKKKFYKQATIEAKILQYIKDKDPKGKANVVKIFNSFMFRKHVVSPSCETSVSSSNYSECISMIK